jgi:hypothetical protein
MFRHDKSFSSKQVMMAWIEKLSYVARLAFEQEKWHLKSGLPTDINPVISKFVWGVLPPSRDLAIPRKSGKES